jgi:lysozyme family protein
MKSNFDQCLALVLKHEGGWVDHPRDPGGETNMGVTKRTWEEWIGKRVEPGSLKTLTVADVAPLYKEKYWDRVKGDSLPDGVDYAVFDYAVNSGVGRAARQLQSCVSVPVDGIIGPKTLAAAQNMPAVALIDCICDNRLAFLMKLATWPTFGRGWSRRVADVRDIAKKMAGEA